jgi:hypothetical protein
MHKKLLKDAGVLLLIIMPLLVVLAWASWYRATFNPFNNLTGNNYRALASLYGKSGVCSDKESLFGQYALTCTDIYTFCSSEPPNIERADGYEVDQTDDCVTYMSATKLFRYLFIPSIIASLVASGAGIYLLVKKPSELQNKKT